MRTLALALLVVMCVALPACVRERTVQAESEEIEGQSATAAKRNDSKITGELVRVDLENSTITVRIPNGMEQTFKLDPSITIDGVPPSASNASVKNHIRKLRGKEGQTVVVEWEDQVGPRLAMSIDLQKPAK